jgi:hypothetical protein
MRCEGRFGDLRTGHRRSAGASSHRGCGESNDRVGAEAPKTHKNVEAKKLAARLGRDATGGYR